MKVNLLAISVHIHDCGSTGSRMSTNNELLHKQCLYINESEFVAYQRTHDHGSTASYKFKDEYQ